MSYLAASNMPHLGLFADDKSKPVAGKSINEIEVRLNHDLDNIKKWLAAKKLSLNIAKTEYMLIGSKQRISALTEQPHILFENDPVERVHNSKIRGVHGKNIDETTSKKIWCAIGAIKRLKDFADRET